MEEEVKQAQEEPILEDDAKASDEENLCPPAPLPEEQSSPAQQSEGAVEGKKKKSLKEIIQYIKEHENLRQPILFFLFSMICGAAQMLTTLVLPMILRAADPGMKESFSWFIFNYTEKGLGEFIGFLVGSVIGQALTFILNRKKTFNVKDHIPFRAIAYAIMAVLIILMQTAIGGGITGALGKADPGAKGIVLAIYNIIAQCVAGIAALVVNFLGNKFFVMRKFGKAKAAEEAEKAAQTENASDLAAQEEPALQEEAPAEEAPAAEEEPSEE